MHQQPAFVAERLSLGLLPKHRALSTPRCLPPTAPAAQWLFTELACWLIYRHWLLLINASAASVRPTAIEPWSVAKTLSTRCRSMPPTHNSDRTAAFHRASLLANLSSLAAADMFGSRPSAGATVSAMVSGAPGNRTVPLGASHTPLRPHSGFSPS
jgi:hypothetical protein